MLSEFADWYVRVFGRVRLLRRESSPRGGVFHPLGWG